MAFCPRCGAEQRPESTFCHSCGFDFRTLAIAPWPVVNDQTIKGLDNLKNSFLFTLLGGVIGIIPFIGILGGLLSLAGLIFTIIAWRGLGRSTLPSAGKYMSTGNWIIYSVVAGIAIAVVAVIAIFALIFGSLANSTVQQNPPTVAQFPGFAESIIVILVLSIPLLVLGIVTFIKIISSLRALSTEVGAPRIKTAASLIILSLVLAIASALVFIFLIAFGFSSLPNPTSSTSPPLFTDFSFLTYFSGISLVIYVTIFVASFITSILANYMGYSGARDAGNKLRTNPPVHA